MASAYSDATTVFNENKNRKVVMNKSDKYPDNKEKSNMYKKHPQLDPLLNRVRKPREAQGFPEPSEPVDYPLADPADPYRNTYLGMIDTPITDDDGIQRDMFCYIPVTEKSAWNMVLVFVPGGKDPKQFFHEGGWANALEKNEMTGFFLPAQNGWKNDDPGFELSTAVKALAEMQKNRYFQSNAPAIYAAGFDDGAKAAAVFALTHVSVLAGWSAWGRVSIDDDLLRDLGNGPSDCDSRKRRNEISLPTLIIDSEESNILEYFKTACDVTDRGLFNRFGRVYQQREKLGESFLNDHSCCEVWHASPDKASEAGIEETVSAIVGFLADYKRWGGEGNGYIRRTVHESDGFIRTEKEIGGLKRYWLTFEPDAYKRSTAEKYPLIIAIHGFTCSGEFFANNTGWHSVGQERGAFVVYPSAYPFKREVPAMGGQHIATPEWNAGGVPSGFDIAGPDELEYFRVLIEDTVSRYPIDKERIYVTGHSNGAMMTQTLMRYMPEYFAGFAPVGFMEGMYTDVPPMPNDIPRNIWYFVGEYDGLGCKLEEGNVNVKTIRRLCEHNKADYEKGKYYESGIYMNHVWRDSSNVPVVRFTGVKNWPHTYSPEVAFMIYDEFFARFVRHSDGSIEYLA